MANKIKLGIIGTGGMAGHHAGQFKAIPGVELTACLDVIETKAQEFAQRHGFKHAITKQSDLLHEVDAVAVVTPDRFHAEVSLDVLKAGNHLLCEKPLTVTLDEAKKVARAAAKAQDKGIIGMINFSYRASSAYQEAIKLVAKGTIGEVRHVSSHYLQSWLHHSVWGGWNNDAMRWRLQTQKGSGGTLGDIGCHILDFTTAVAGDLQSVRCSFATFPKIDKDGGKHTSYQGVPFDANDSFIAELHFAAGGLGVCQASRWATGKSNSLALMVHGTQGALSIDLDAGYSKLNICHDYTIADSSWETRVIKATPSNYQRFIEAIKTGKPDQPDIARGAQVQAYLEACQRSAKSGKVEKIPSWK
jgi:predicted dehydrogenase